MEESASIIMKKPAGPPLWTFEATLTIWGIVAVSYLLILQGIRIYMRNREPYKLKTVLFWYNLIQVFLSLYGVGYCVQFFYTFGYAPTGDYEVDKSQEWIDRYTFAQYLFNLYKHIDLLDTFFFALRKKDNQITFLHVYHHVTMTLWGWIVAVYIHSDQHIVPGVVNCTIHFFMYFYYLMASLGPDYAKYIWWKRHLTKLQLLQFVIILTHVTYFQMTAPYPTPTFVFLYAIGNPTVYFILFMNFYLKSYQKPKKS